MSRRVSVGPNSYRELQKRASELGLKASGTREELQSRLEEYDRTKAVEPVPEKEEAEEEEEEEEEEGAPAGGAAAAAAEEASESESETSTEFLGVLVRRKHKTPAKAKEEGDSSEDEEVLFVPADEVNSVLDDEEDDEYVPTADELEGDDEDEEEEDALFADKRDTAKLACTFFLSLEVLLFFLTLVLNHTLHTPVAPTSVNSTEVPDPKTPSNTFFAMFFASLIDQAVNLSFWLTLAEYGALLVALPTLVGMLMGRIGSADSVLGFGVSRFVVWYLINTAGLLPLVSATLYLPLFNVTCALSVVLAFWDKQL